MPTEHTPPVPPAEIYDALRASIIAQRDAPGSSVTESAVAVRFGVARQTAKAAIERLVGEGLLRREAHKAARVPTLTAEDIRDLYDNRAIIESAAAAALTGLPAAALTAHHSLLEAARTGGAFAAQDIEFHRALVAGQPSERLARMHALLMGEIELCIGQVQAGRLLDAAVIARQHQGILDAVVAGDSERASRLTLEHVAHARDALLAAATA